MDKIHIVNTVRFRTNVLVIQEPLVTPTRHADLNERLHAVKHHAESVPNAVKTVYHSTVSVHPVISAILSSSVMTSMNVRMGPVVMVPFV